jgi:HEAT repeats
MTCLGFARSSVGATAMPKQEAPQPIPSDIETTTPSQFFSSSNWSLVAQTSSPNPSPKPTDTLPNLNNQPPAPKKARTSRLSQLKWPLLWVGTGVVFVAIAGGLYYLQKRLNDQSESVEQQPQPDEASQNPDDSGIKLSTHPLESGNNGYSTPISSKEEKYYSELSATPIETDTHSHNNPFSSFEETPFPDTSTVPPPVEANSNNSAISPSVEKPQPEASTPQPPAEALQVQETTRLSKINIVEALIKELHSPDPPTRRKAIWELAQRGDSRAMQPLLELMMDADSQERSLILEALSQIGTRTIKPMNRALTISLQDDNAEVRKNAIRDLTRIYDLINQANKLLLHAVDDPDKEVQETARWALNQLSKIRNFSENQPK